MYKKSDQLGEGTPVIDTKKMKSANLNLPAPQVT